MKAGKTGSRLLSVGLCALIALLVIKLALTVIGALHAGPETTAAVPEAMAREEKPKIKADNAAPPAPAAQISPRVSVVNSMSIFQQKEVELRKKEERLNEEEQQLTGLKKEVEQKIKDLLALQKQVQSAQSQKRDTQNAKVQGLARIYGTMKPKQAAKLMGSLDDNLVKSIISTMPPNQAASILALMDVKKAARISEALSGQ